jgi:exoribonuclease-2
MLTRLCCVALLHLPCWLQAHLRGEALPFSAAAISAITAAAGESARELGRAENEVTKYWAAEYLRQHREQSWTGCVLGWFRPEMQLAAVTLEELGLESIVKVGAWVEWGCV